MVVEEGTEQAQSDPLAERLMRLSAATGVSGHEGEVARLIAGEMQAWADEVRTDRLGNCIALRRGQPPAGVRAPRLMLAAHMDEIGMVVSRIDKGGFLRVSPMGGVNVQTLMGQSVTVHAAGGPVPGVVGLKPPHLTTPEERKEFPRWEDLFVDCGLNEEEARSRIQVGDIVSVDARPVTLLGDRVAGKALDNRASVAVLMEAMQRLSALRHAADVLAVATVQEEVGLRGAEVSAFGLEPDLAVAVDVTFARQRMVGEPDVTELGKGPAIAWGANMHPRIVERLHQTARLHGVPFQVEVVPGRSGTDAWAIQVARAGIPTALVSVPLRYMHTPVEVVDLRDIRETGRLLAHFAAGLDAGLLGALSDWGVATVGR
ncbi:MAG: M42 family metallopeptidase [Limnochordaceae bacterium]|nr:M42 family metallopeptidase [Limnochordaceae bacterium]